MRRFTTGIALGTIVLTAFVMYGGAAANAASSLSVTPSTNLTNGQIIAVAGTGFTPNDSVYVIECLATTTATSQKCDLATATATTVSPTGGVMAKFAVATGVIFGSTTCGTNASDATNCIVAVGNINGGDTGATPITFAVSSATTTTTTPTTTTTTTKFNPGPRHFYVSPVAGLKNNSRVKVWGTGFKPGDHVNVIECLASVKSSAQCDLKTHKALTVNGRGVLPTTMFKVVTGRIGTGTCGTKPSNLKSCVIYVSSASRGDAAIAHIAFKR